MGTKIERHAPKPSFFGLKNIKRTNFQPKISNPQNSEDLHSVTTGKPSNCQEVCSERASTLESARSIFNLKTVQLSFRSAVILTDPEIQVGKEQFTVGNEVGKLKNSSLLLTNKNTDPVSGEFFFLKKQTNKKTHTA